MCINRVTENKRISLLISPGVKVLRSGSVTITYRTLRTPRIKPTRQLDNTRIIVMHIRIGDVCVRIL